MSPIEALIVLVIAALFFGFLGWVIGRIQEYRAERNAQCRRDEQLVIRPQTNGGPLEVPLDPGPEDLLKPERIDGEEVAPAVPEDVLTEGPSAPTSAKPKRKRAPKKAAPKRKGN